MTGIDGGCTHARIQCLTTTPFPPPLAAPCTHHPRFPPSRAHAGLLALPPHGRREAPRADSGWGHCRRRDRGAIEKCGGGGHLYRGAVGGTLLPGGDGMEVTCGGMSLFDRPVS